MDFLMSIVLGSLIAMLCIMLFTVMFGGAYVALCCLAGVNPEKTTIAVSVKSFLGKYLKEAKE